MKIQIYIDMPYLQKVQKCQNQNCFSFKVNFESNSPEKNHAENHRLLHFYIWKDYHGVVSLNEHCIGRR